VYLREGRTTDALKAAELACREATRPHVQTTFVNEGQRQEARLHSRAGRRPLSHSGDDAAHAKIRAVISESVSDKSYTPAALSPENAQTGRVGSMSGNNRQSTQNAVFCWYKTVCGNR
jgi:hypothetical protein